MDIIYDLWFSKVDSLNITQKNALINLYEDPQVIFGLPQKELEKTGIFKKQESINRFLSSQNLEKLDKDLNFMEKNQIEFISFNNKLFPQKFREIHNSPIGIYVKGELDLLNAKPVIAIVGARNASKSGLKYAHSFSQKLSAMGISIISGLAAGIDGQAHWGSLDEPGKTIAVLGNGLDQCYPKEHNKLFKEIQKKGLLISEFNLGDKPLGYHFPIRNRLISALSDGVLVIEANKKSGSLITVNHALDQGKNVYVIPGEINNPNWAGSNILLKEGANLVTDPGDILEDYIFLSKNSKLQNSQFKVKIDFNDPVEEQIYNGIIKGYDNVDELVAITGIGVIELSTHLTMMEIDGIIRTDNGKLKISDDFS